MFTGILFLTMCIASGLWMAEESVGDAGPTSLGYYTCCWRPDGNALVAHGYTGALHLWCRDGLTGAWLPQKAVGEHG